MTLFYNLIRATTQIIDRALFLRLLFVEIAIFCHLLLCITIEITSCIMAPPSWQQMPRCLLLSNFANLTRQWNFKLITKQKKMRTHTNTHIQTCSHTQTHTQTYTHTHTHTQTHTHIDTHTHIHLHA